MAEDQYKTISEDGFGEGFYSEKRSKFLAFAHHVTSVDEVKTLLASYRKKYYDARHCCYAYVLGPKRYFAPMMMANRVPQQVNLSWDKSTVAGLPTSLSSSFAIMVA